jgi:hypothetical protein
MEAEMHVHFAKIGLAFALVSFSITASAAKTPDTPCPSGLLSTPKELKKLRNGSMVPGPIVGTVWVSLSWLMRNNPIVAYELIERARDPNYDLSPQTTELLVGLALLEADGKTMHEAVRDVLLSSAKGEGLAMEFIFPIEILGI